MIGSDAAQASRILEAFRAAAGRPAEPEAAPLEATALDPLFPGAILPWSRGPDRVPFFYAVAASPAEWRRLRPLLLAFAGPTLTNFQGAPHRLDGRHPQEQVLIEAGAHLVARLVPSPATAASARRALGRMITMVAKTPVRAEAPPESTSRLLARLRDHLNALAIPQAQSILAQCRREHRLDALNLRFLEIEILTAARDWSSIASLPAFSDIVQTRRPPAVSAAMLESLYQVHFQDAPHDLDLYVQTVAPRARDLVRLPPVRGLARGAWRLYAMEALSDAPNASALAGAALASGEDLADLTERLIALAPPPVTEPASDPAARVAASVAAAEIGGGLADYGAVIAAIEALTPAERDIVFQGEMARRGLATLRAEFGDDAPGDWLAWLEALARPAFPNSATLARGGAETWPAEALEDPAHAIALAEALDAAPEDAVGGARLLDGLPHLVAWFQRDPEFPRASSAKAYEATLRRLVLGERFSTPMLDSAGVLARALLAIGISRTDYGALLIDLLGLAGEAAGSRSAYWLIEMIEETLAATAPDQAAREQFWHGALARLAPIAEQLSALQRMTLVALATSLGWLEALPSALAAPASPPRDADLATRLGTKQIGIYTLTESAALQAATMLKTLAPDVDVRINSEHVGGASLRALSENADLFVVVAGSAKHAATDFIRARRGDKPLVYAAGKGASSILRAIEDWSRLERV
jgi:hypothetical protein